MSAAQDTRSDAALVAALIGSTDESRGYALLQRCGGLRALARPEAGALAEQTGPAYARRLLAAVELGRRVVSEASKDAASHIPDAEGVHQWARARLATLDHEELWILCLDGRHGLRAAHCVASGGIHGLHIGVRDVLRYALREAASGFILTHNHPSGDPTPSTEDVEFTRAVAQAARVVGCPLLDHVVVSRARFRSMLLAGASPQ